MNPLIELVLALMLVWAAVGGGIGISRRRRAVPVAPAKPVRSPEWLAAARELDELFPEVPISPQDRPSLNIPRVHREMMSMTHEEQMQALKRAFRERQRLANRPTPEEAEIIRQINHIPPGHEVVRNMAGQVVAMVPTAEEISRAVSWHQENALPSAIITVPEGCRYERIGHTTVEYGRSPR